jgi:hypothetical protein
MQQTNAASVISHQQCGFDSTGVVLFGQCMPHGPLLDVQVARMSWPS